jgi:ElaB/YqjD/DUF883 family membrane-anchored ribosome-binding protein
VAEIAVAKFRTRKGASRFENEVMQEQADIAQRSLRYTKDQFEEVLQQTEDYVRQNPARAVGFALVAGFILNRLPLGRILSGLVRLLFIAFKPAVLAYGATKLYQAAQTDEL